MRFARGVLTAVRVECATHVEWSRFASRGVRCRALRLALLAVECAPKVGTRKTLVSHVEVQVVDL